MPRHTWTIAGLLVLGLALIVVSLAARRAGFEADRARAAMAAAEASGNREREQSLAAQVDLETAREHLKALQAELAREKEQAVSSQQSIEAEMRSALVSKEITISQLQGKLTVSILDRVMFDSGDALIKPEGTQVLQQLARVLAQHTNRQIHVMGHTDNVPIRPGSRSGLKDNWDLSAARALAAVRYLQEHAGVDPRRLAAVGYGEYHPRADNSTPEGRAQNRRIAIVVYPAELSGDDLPRKSPALAAPKPATNSDPVIPLPPVIPDAEIKPKP